MTKLFRFSTLAVLLSASLAVQADAGDWYLAPSIVYTDDDGDRLIDDSVAGGQIQVGREMSERFSLEGLLGYHDIDGFPGQEHLELGINAVGNFRPDSRFSPYVIGGLGLLRADVGLPDFGGLPPAGSTSNSLMATAGLGLKINFGDSPWALRTEYRLRHAFDDDGLTDHIGSVGIQYSFGGGSARAMSTPVSEPEPAAEPEPVVQPDPDSDGDGVVDARDACANTPRGVEVDASGCEVMAPIELSPVYFATESAVLDDLAKRTLDENVAILSEYPDLQVDITGHADSRGPEEYNMGLSQRRAESVRRYLEDAGVNPANLNALGFGESRPVASNETAAGQAKNRRVELEVLDR